jgi:phage-related protein
MIVFNGVSSDTYNALVYRVRTDDGPSLSIESYEIPGRSGDLLVSDKRFPNVEQSYSAVFTGEDAEKNFSDFKNFLLSQTGYQRLEDSDHPDEFYLAYVSKNIEPVLTKDRSKVKCVVTFSRKPQRFLVSGETEYAPLSGVIEGREITTDTTSIEPSDISVSYDIPASNKAAGSYGNIRYEFVNGLRLYVNGMSYLYESLDYNVLQGDFDLLTGGTITKIAEAFPTAGWSKVSGYASRFETSFTPIGTITGCSFLVYKTDGQPFLTGDVRYDSTNHKLIAAAPTTITTVDAFVNYINSIYEGAYLAETVSIAKTWARIVGDLPDGWNTLSTNSEYGKITITVTGNNVLTNPGLFPAKPMIRVYGTGVVEINDITITISDCTSYVDIDCDAMDCYEGATNRNKDVTFSTYDFPILAPGDNTFVINSGVTSIKVQPRWWRL